MMRRRPVMVSSVLALVLSAVACGDDTVGSSIATTPSTAGVAPTVVSGITITPESGVSYDTGVTQAPCPDAVNVSNGCIYLGVITDLTDGPFAAEGVSLTHGQEDFWGAVNAAGGVGGWDVIVSSETMYDSDFDAARTIEGYGAIRNRVLALAQMAGTPQTLAALAALTVDDSVAIPVTSWSGWAFTEFDGGLILESGAPYCFEAMNGMFFAAYEKETDPSWALVSVPGHYGGDYAAGARLAAARLGIAPPVVEMVQMPVADGGTVDETVTRLLAAQPELIMIATGPVEMALIIVGLTGGGFTNFQVIGASPTWNAAFTADAGLMTLLQGLYRQTAPWGGWDSGTSGHAAMRAAAEDNARSPSGPYMAGWISQYPMLALLTEAVAGGDLTHSNLAALAANLENVDYQGMLPTRSYTGSPADHVERSTIINGVDPASADGVGALTDFFISEVAADFDLEQPCFVS